MPSLDTQWLLDTLILLAPLLFSLVIHEYAHARTAFAFGDHTAYYLGRMTLNPLAHLDPIGTLCIILTGFGWAKPVPVNPLKLYPRKLGSIAVSLAGPLSNLFLGVVAALLLRLWVAVEARVPEEVFGPVYGYLLYLVSVNVVLCTFNLIPLFPLDGHHVVRDLLPIDGQQAFMDWQRRFGSVVLLALLFGPRLVSMLAPAANVPDPLGWVFRHVRLVVRTILGI